MIKLYHNPRCGKSREGLAILEESGKEFEIIRYLDSNIAIDELKSLIEKLNITPLELVRQKEKIWVENYKGKQLSDDEIIMAMIENPILIERPIAINGLKAIIGRPPSNIKKIL